MWQLGTTRSRHKLPLALILSVLAVVMTWPAGVAEAAPARITAVSVKAFPNAVQLAVTGSGILRFRAMSMDNPLRVVIDLPGAVLASGVPQTYEVGKGPIIRVRAGQFQQTPPVARIAVDLSLPVQFEVMSQGPQLLVARFDMARTAISPDAAPRRPARTAKVGGAVAETAQQEPGVVPAAPPSRITVDLRGAELSDVLNALARMCGFNIVTDAGVRGAITVRLVDVTCDEALRFVLEANNLGFRRVGRNLIVMPADKLTVPPEVPEPIVYTLGFANADQVRAAVAAAVPGVRIAIDARTNMLIVFGTAIQHDQVKKILSSLDVKIAQIMIETRVVDIDTQVLRDMGLDWSFFSFRFPVAPGGVPSNVIAPPTIQIGTVATGDIVASITAMVRERRVRVITAPRVSVVEGNKATVNLGEEIPVPQIDQNGRISFTFKPVGVLLEITPRLGPGGVITTALIPEVSAVTELLPTPAGPIPRIATRKANTIVQVKEGESIVIAGMITAEQRNTIIKVPLLGEIPIVGMIFRRTTTDRRESEVIFIITPIVTDRGPSR